MIGLIGFELRRAWRRRLTILLLVVPAALVAYALIGKWTGRPMCPLTPWLVTATSSILLFGQALLSDREGGVDAILVAAPLPRWFAPVRQGMLLVGPFVAQMAVYTGLARLLGVG